MIAPGRLQRVGSAAVLLVYLILGTVYSVVTPVFEAPDESFHFFVVKHLVDQRRLPVQRAEKDAPWAQEGSQPPLYYLAGALLVGGIDLDGAERLLWTNPQANIGDPMNPGNKNVYVHTPDQDWPWQGAVLAVHVLRFFSLALGAGTVWLVWRIARLLYPSQPSFCLAVAATAAFLPQFLFITAAVNNDNAMTFLAALALYLMLCRLQQAALRLGGGGSLDEREALRPEGCPYKGAAGEDVAWVALGAVLGLALLAKLSALALLPMAGLVIGAAAWHRRSWRFFWRASVLVALPALVLAGWWYARNQVLYGEPTGLSAMWQVVGRRQDFGQDLWGEFRALRYSFWGLFGWFSLPLPGSIYRLLDVLSALALAGAGLEVGRWLANGLWRGARSALLYREVEWGAAYRPLAWGLMGLWLGVMSLALLRWTSLTQGTQGRLLFPALAPIALLLVAGLRVWFLPRLRSAAGLGLACGMCVLGAIAPWLWIAPAYARPQPLAELPAGAIALDLVFDETVALRGVGYDRAAVHPGQPVQVDLYWEMLAPLPQEQELMIGLRLVDPRGGFVGVEDVYLGSGIYPASLWPSGQLFRARESVLVGADAAAPLVASLQIEVYHRQQGAVLEPSAAGDAATIGRVKVLPRRWPRLDRDAIVARFGQPCAPESAAGLDISLAVPAAGGPDPAWRAAPGGALEVGLLWGVHAPPPRDYAVFVHLEDENGQIYGYGDGPPRAGRYPVWVWEADEVVEDLRLVEIDAATPPGVYHLVAGLYNPDGRVPACTPSGRSSPDSTRWAGDAVLLGLVEVR